MAAVHMHHAASAHAQVHKSKALGQGNAQTVHTVTALNRWSVADKQLPCRSPHPAFQVCKLTVPAVDKIKAIHVYDFDNTREPSHCDPADP